ncbi:MAG: M48 family metallopeptidase [Bacillota bacterium]
MEAYVYIAIMTLYIGVTLFDFYVSKLNSDARENPVPTIVDDIYDKEEYDKWKAYSRRKADLSLFSRFFRFLFILLMLMFGGFQALNLWTIDITDSIYLSTLLFFAILFVLETLFSTLFSYINTFKIEEAFGFNTSTKRLFVKDTLISFILSTVLLGGVLLLVLYLLTQFETLFLLLAFVILFAIILVINMFYVKLIVPIFNTLTPLEDGDLKTKIEKLAKQEGYEISSIKVVNASKRSKKLNAFFSGFGTFKTVVLYDTLLEAMDDEEILAVLAHEIGHAKHGDILKNVASSAVMLLVMLALFNLFINVEILYEAFGLESVTLGFGILLFFVVMNPLMVLFSLYANRKSREREFKADAFAVKATRKEAMEGALRILAYRNYSNLTPHPLYVKLHYSHPPVATRIYAIREVSND